MSPYLCYGWLIDPSGLPLHPSLIFHVWISSVSATAGSCFSVSCVSSWPFPTSRRHIPLMYRLHAIEVTSKPDFSPNVHNVESYDTTESQYGLICFLCLRSMNLTWRDMQHLVVRTSRPGHLSAGDWKTNGVGRRGSGLVELLSWAFSEHGHFPEIESENLRIQQEKSPRKFTASDWGAWMTVNETCPASCVFYPECYKNVPVDVNRSDLDRLLLCSLYVKGKLQRMSRPRKRL